VEWMAKSLTGWYLDDSNPDNVTVHFDPGRWFNGPKNVFGVYGNYKDRDVVDLVLGRPAHAPYLLNKLSSEFVARPPDAATLTDPATASNAARERKPVLRKSLSPPQLFSSTDEPNMLKPPVVYVVGVMRTLGTPITDPRPLDYLSSMDQVPYFPPTVA